MDFNLAITNATNQRFSYRLLLEKLLKEVNSVPFANARTHNLSLVIITPRAMEELCRAHFSNKKITDVLAFPSGMAMLPNGEVELGEIFIVPSIVVKQAKAYRHSVRREWSYLFLHAVFHLLGHDHQTPAAEANMHALVETILVKHGIIR